MKSPTLLTGDIEMVGKDAIQRHPENARKGNLDAIKGSIEAHGWYSSLVVQKSTGYILVGNHRFAAGLELGMQEFPVQYVDVGDDQARKILLVDNRTNDIAGYDTPALELIIQQVLDNTGDLKGTGFTEEDYEAMILEAMAGSDQGEPPPARMEKATELQEKWQVQVGDVWRVGNHKIMCGDCTKPADITCLMVGSKANLLTTDPPYGVSYSDKNTFLNAIDKGNRIQTKIEGDHETPADMSAFWITAFKAVRPFMVQGASYYVTGPQGGDLLLLLLQALREADFPLRHMLIWAKNNHVLGRCDYHYKHEPIIFGWVKGTHSFFGDAGETSLWEIPRPNNSDSHPTMKPVELYERAIRNSSKLKGIVLDPFSGSGTCMVAAERQGRYARCMEIAPAYVAVTLDRMQQMSLTPELLEKRT